MNKKLLWIYLGVVVLLGISFFVDDYVNESIVNVHNSFLDYFTGIFTHLGSVVMILIVMTTLFMWQERKREWIPTLWVSFIVTIGLGLLLKFAFMRARPIGIEMLPLINLVDYSFPSLHAAVAFSALPVLDKEYPKFKWVWLVFALLVAFNRIYLQVHFLSDVVAGGLFGFTIGLLFVKLEEKKKVFKRWIFSK